MKGRMRQILHALLKVAARNAGQPTLNLGGCAPPPPRPLSLDRQRKGGKKARPWRHPRGFYPRRATPSPHICLPTALRESRALALAQKPCRPHAPARGKKRRAGQPIKNAPPLELEVRD